MVDLFKMQKLINVLALSSFVVSAAVVGGGTWLYLNKDVMIEDIRKKATEQVTKAITEALPGIIDAALPEMPEIPEVPDKTGGVLPF